ncbi:MAG: GumC family protein [candidate division WOR-3 bacterium]
MNQGIDLGRIFRAFSRRRWVFLTAVAVGLLGSLLWLFRQKTVTVYMATAKLVSAEKNEESSQDIIPSYLYPGSSDQESRMGRVAADIMSLDFLARVARETGITYIVTRRGSPYLYVEDFSVADTTARGAYRINMEADGYYAVEGPMGTSKGRLGEPFTDSLVHFTLLSSKPQEGDFMEFRLVSPMEVASLLQGGISISIAKLSEVTTGIQLPSGPGFKGPLVMSITVVWDDPSSAAILATGIARAAVDENLKRKRAQFEQSKTFISQQMETYSQELSRIADEMRNFREREGVVDISAEQTRVAQRLAEKDAQLAALEAEERQLRSIIDWIKGADSIPGYIEFLIDDSRINALFADARATSLELAEATKSLGENHPDVKALRARLASLKSELSSAISDRQKALSLAKSNLRAEMEREKANLGDIMEKELQYLQLERQREAVEDIYTLLAQRYEEIRIQEASVTSDVTVLEEAGGASVMTTKPRFLRIPVLGLIIGLLVGIALVLIMEYMDSTIREEAERALGGRDEDRLRYIATIPRADMAESVHGAQPVVLRDPMFMEVFRIAALNTGLFGPLKKNSTLCVTSPGSGEGKTTIALNLAASLAASGERVLLVDADANKRTLSSLLGLLDRKGFFEILVNGSSPEDVMAEGPLPNLMIIPIGREIYDPLNLLSENYFRSFLAKTRDSFDIVIFDTPPALLLAEAGVLAPQVDATLLVARVHSTDSRDLLKAFDILTNAGARVAGVILNMSKLRRSSYYYYGKDKPSPWWKRLLIRG